MKNENIEKILQEEFIEEVDKIYKDNQGINLENKKSILESKYKSVFNEVCNLLEEQLGSEADSLLYEIERMFGDSKEDIERYIDELEGDRQDNNAVKSILSRKMEDLCYELEEVSQDENIDMSVEIINTNINNANILLDEEKKYENNEIKEKVVYKVEDSVMTELKAEVLNFLYNREIENYEISSILDDKLFQEILAEFEECDRITEENILDKKEELLEYIKEECVAKLQEEIEQNKEKNGKEEYEETTLDFSDELKAEVKSFDEIMEEPYFEEEKVEIQKDKEKEVNELEEL